MSTMTIYGRFLEQVEKTPDALAVRDGQRDISFAELSALVDGVAQMIPQGSRFVGIVMDHGVEMIASVLAVLKSGAAYVPAEPSFPIDRIRYMLAEADVDAAITQQAYDGLFQGAHRVYVEKGFVPSTCDTPASDCSKPSNLAYVLYTSGTTGNPKGVSVENRNVVSYIDSFEYEFGIGAGDVMMQYSVCSFDIFVEEVFSALLNGAALAIVPETAKATPQALASFIEEAGVTIVDGFPYLLADINGLDVLPAGVRLYVSGGDVLRAKHCDRLIEQAVVYNTYGPSETTCCAAYYCASDGAPLDDGTYPVGKAVSCDDMLLVDERLNPVPDGEVGEILITGAGVSRGYLADCPEQANFIALPGGGRGYLSGDLGYVMEDGNVAFLHRKDAQVMIDGRRVECSEVENVLDADPAVSHAVVKPYRDEGDLSYMVAYVELADEEAKLSDIKARISRKLAGFMVPEFFVKMNAIPLNANGKPDSSALPVVMKAS